MPGAEVVRVQAAKGTLLCRRQNRTGNANNDLGDSVWQ